MSVLDTNIPIYRFFEEISDIPRGSGNEEGISRYLASFAEARGLRYVRDSLNNVVIYKGGTAGRENEAPLMLQAHMDMVCEQVGGGCCAHDFLTDPLKLIRDGDLLRADGTTLGADDGVGVSWMLAILDAADLSHPPLECVFTANEETGMDGARGLKKDLITARRMIGYLSHYDHLPEAELVDEMLAILSDRARIMQHKDMINTNAAWNELMSQDIFDTEEDAFGEDF